MTTYVKPGSPHDQGFLDNNFHRRSYEEDMDGTLRKRVNCLTGLVVVVCIIAAASLALSVMLLMQDQGDVTVSDDLKLRLSSLEDMMHNEDGDHQKHMSVQQSVDSNKENESKQQTHSRGADNIDQDISKEDTMDYHEYGDNQDEIQSQMSSEEDISVERHDDKETTPYDSQGSSSKVVEDHIQEQPQYPGITFEEKPAPVLPPFTYDDDIHPDDEDYDQEGSGLGSGPCPMYSRPVCPTGFRICLTKEKCSKPVCCR